MVSRAHYADLAPEAIKILMNQEGYLHKQFSKSNTVTSKVWELVKLRVSQINQCAFCIDIHSKDALNQGETPERILA